MEEKQDTLEAVRQLVAEAAAACTDENLLDLVYKMLIMG